MKAARSLAIVRLLGICVSACHWAQPRWGGVSGGRAIPGNFTNQLHYALQGGLYSEPWDRSKARPLFVILWIGPGGATSSYDNHNRLTEINGHLGQSKLRIVLESGALRAPGAVWNSVFDSEVERGAVGVSLVAGDQLDDHFYCHVPLEAAFQQHVNACNLRGTPCLPLPTAHPAVSGEPLLDHLSR